MLHTVEKHLLTVAFASAMAIAAPTGSQAGVMSVVDNATISSPSLVNQSCFYHHRHWRYAHYWRHHHYRHWRYAHYWHRPYYYYYGYAPFNPFAALVGGLAGVATAPLFGWW